MWHILYKQAFTAFLSNITMEKTLLLIDDDPDDIEMFCEQFRKLMKKITAFVHQTGEKIWKY